MDSLSFLVLNIVLLNSLISHAGLLTFPDVTYYIILNIYILYPLGLIHGYKSFIERCDTRKNDL